jgi:WD40 repeat protein
LQDGTVRLFTHSPTGFVANAAMLVTDPAGATTRSVRFSRDGTLLAAGNGLGQLFFWRYPITSPMPTLPIVDVGTPTTSDDVNWLAFSPDSRTIAVAGAYAPSVSTFAVTAPRALVGLNRTPTDNLQSITYSPNGAALLAGGVTCGYVLVCAD